MTRSGLCIVADCLKPSLSRGLCTQHYQRRRYHGDAEYERPVPPRNRCKVDGCDKLARARGWCRGHYTRWYNHRPISGTLRQKSERGMGANSGPEYQRWRNMIARCYLPSNVGYKYYGGRGIKVCKRWRESFAEYLADLGKHPGKEYSVDRKNNDGHYSCGKCHECVANGWPANWRWATRTQQNINQRLSVTNKSGYRGVCKRPDGKWWAYIRYQKRTIHLGYFAIPEEAAVAYNIAALKYHGKDAMLNELPRLVAA